ncbi:RNA polymerase, sigma-24 subunit, ECF subfamily [Catenulispora acidiphila DSM 44928]|uniref:RNA polymerase, sigma-24 subunit, ECF subfamily n=1 Tax=Catenulispora acidiphila (strain DSM 44928 / JCM 14897 / NBRC 102108 / NRRL B-24433 / ID139908) TaxID=479433 RepID=C7Q6G2_CATAD|nr:sigma-70 family RNA polymerase sigma factor [Catenulispora acidiphila]ACU73997.1 RNA polymerase, sigma-24 subunit, ECF subfamily [Catenulispora acidiphila DSM 44928]
MSTATAGTPTDTDTDTALVRAAQTGDVAALALLLEQHRAGMRAVALSILGPGPDADDAIQDAVLVALRRIGDVRDPAAAGAWLRMIVRNQCRGQLRDAQRLVPLDELASHRDSAPGPDELLENHAMQDWLWEAIEQLSPALRLTLVLRHFSEHVTAYDQIARVCGVPAGTVRSRLNQARAKLAAALAATAEAAHSDARTRTAASWDEAHDTLATAEAGEFGRVVAQRWSPDVALMYGGSRLGGSALITRAMDCDLAAGVRQRPVKVIAGRSLAVWEMDITSPPDNPEHCPPTAAWVMDLDGGRVARLRLFHPRPLAESVMEQRLAA